MATPSEQVDERAPLLPPSHVSNTNGLPRADSDHTPERERRKHDVVRLTISSILTLLFISAIVAVVTFFEDGMSKDPERAALAVLANTPVVDGHIDLPELIRVVYKNNISAFDLREHMPGHVDIPRMKRGRVGGFFWSVYVDCKDAGPDFLTPTNRVRDTLEQIDVSKLLIQKYSDTFMLATSASDIREAFRVGKIASLIGVEGAHQLGNSLSVLRQYHSMGARYLTLTHSCNNAFADSAGISSPVPPVHGGLSEFGKDLVLELNRLGMLIDISHVSDNTAAQALQLSRAPVIFSHSSARAVHNVIRNVPDYILRMIGTSKDKKDAVVMVNFSSDFVASPGNATVVVVADHVEHIGRIAGREHVGIGSDYDGVASTPIGLEDISKYPALFIELRRRGWSRAELAGLASANLLRVLQGAEMVSHQMSFIPPSMSRYEKRDDL